VARLHDELERSRTRENWSPQRTRIRVETPTEEVRPGLFVTLIDPNTGERIASRQTGADGVVYITYEGPSSTDDNGSRRVDVVVSNQFGEQLVDTSIEVSPDGTSEITVEDTDTTDELDPVSGFPDLTEQLSTHGYTTPISVADSSPTALQRELGGEVSRARIERAHLTAVAQRYLLDSNCVDRRARIANGRDIPDWQIDFGETSDNGGNGDE
jgi:hypothetical protein